MQEDARDCNGEVLEGYLTRREAARQVRRSEQALIRWENEGYGPPVTRVGRQVLYKKSSLSKWLEAREEQPKTLIYKSQATARPPN
jgi:predicted site-specific integrase-resolvase